MMDFQFQIYTIIFKHFKLLKDEKILSSGQYNM